MKKQKKKKKIKLIMAHCNDDFHHMKVLSSITSKERVG